MTPLPWNAAAPREVRTNRAGIRLCENVNKNADRPGRCLWIAIFRVRMGTRKSDEQLSCARHLAFTVRAFQEADDAMRPPTVEWRGSGWKRSE